ncbi:DUF3021 domain-containing protein [Ruminococcus sp.]|uniref:DUF3021 domain-containing protein n=1 Tax=Ruminococcus sp. TaxID=41978 RepID=UPI0026048AB8|nr:DUF3021 domain-containing protein [Ruminococcus sp.]MDD6988231.1 DUF3021 domain-containing protein [Ruminococcus sp.]MDY6201707.1 DUF3021 domain-containing protein [Ruminococcus sp.]
MKNIIKSIVLGIGWGFTVFVVYLTIGVFISSDFLAGIAQDDFIKYVICSAVIGLGFSVPSLIYRNERISRGLQVIIHLGTGFTIYVPVAFFAGWIPTAYGAIAVAISLLCAVVFSLLVWLCFALYYRKQAQEINRKIVEKQQTK